MSDSIQFGACKNPAPQSRQYGLRPAMPSSDLPSKTSIKVPEGESFISRMPQRTTKSRATVLGDRATGGKRESYIRATQSSKCGNESNVERPLTCNEAAEFVRVHPKTVKRMAARGALPGHFRFGRWYFYPSELDSWMRTELHSTRHSCR